MPKANRSTSSPAPLYIVLAVAAALAAYRMGGFIKSPFADGDLFWQRRLGEYVLTQHAIPHALGNDVFSATGAPWVPQEWIFSCFVSAAFDHGALWLLAAISGLLAFAAIAIVVWRAFTAGATIWPLVIAVVLASVAIAPNFALRAEVWVWPLFACLLLALDGTGRRLWWVVAIVLVWANVHASVMIAIPIVCLNAAIAFWQRRPDARLRLLLCIVSALATLCTPFGIHLPLYALEVLHSPLRAYISQWQPSFTPTVYREFGFFPLVALTAIALARRVWATRPFDAILATLFAVLAFFATRNVALFSLAAIVPASLAMNGWFEQPRFLTRLPRRAIAGCVAIAVTAALGGVVGFVLGRPEILWPGPYGSVQLLAATPGDHRLYCAEYSWCSVALGHKNIRIFLDGRADPYPPQVWAAHATITHARPGWQQLLNQYDIDAVIAWRGGYFETQMQTLRDWTEDAQTGDPCCVLFLKDT